MVIGLPDNFISGTMLYPIYCIRGIGWGQGVRMSYVEFTKWQCCMSLSLRILYDPCWFSDIAKLYVTIVCSTHVVSVRPHVAC